jgi:hypothetical protein
VGLHLIPWGHLRRNQSLTKLVGSGKMTEWRHTHPHSHKCTQTCTHTHTHTHTPYTFRRTITPCVCGGVVANSLSDNGTSGLVSCKLVQGFQSSKQFAVLAMSAWSGNRSLGSKCVQKSSGRTLL